MSENQPTRKSSVLAELLLGSRRLKVTQRMWLSLQVLLVLLVVSGLNSILMLQRINDDVVQMVEVEVPLEEAVLELEINVGESARGVLDFVRNLEQADLDRVHDSKADFERNADVCVRLAETDEERRLVEQVTLLYREFKKLGDRIIALANERQEALIRIRHDVKDIDELIEAKVKKSINRSDLDATKKLVASLEMEVNINEAFAAIESYILHPDPAFQREVVDAEKDFQRFAAMYREASLTDDEQKWLSKIDEWFSEAVMLGNQIMTISDDLRQSLDRFEDYLEEIDEILDDRIQPLLQIAILHAEDDVKQSGKIAIAVTLITSFLALAMLGGMMAFTSRYFMRKMRGLVEGADQFGRGNLSHRIPCETQDEMGELAVAFNEMAEKRERAEQALQDAYCQIEKHNVELEGLVAERAAEVIAVRDLAVFSLAQLADSRDPETGEHLLRLRTYSQILAEQLGREGPYVDEIDDRFLDDLYRASPLHDIGKVGISDAILLKPGRLTPSEFELMKLHVIVGAEALDKGMQHGTAGRFLRMAADVTRFHHERFDGTGYCAGLSGHEIPLAARIVALADVFDALTSKRVYKPAYSHQKAREIIEEGSGTHFDPAIVEAFQACYDEFLDVHPQGTVEEPEFQKEMAHVVGF